MDGAEKEAAAYVKRWIDGNGCMECPGREVCTFLVIDTWMADNHADEFLAQLARNEMIGYDYGKCECLKRPRTAVQMALF